MDSFLDTVDDSGLAMDDSWVDSDSDADSVATMRPAYSSFSQPSTSHRATRPSSPAPGSAPDWRRLYLTRAILRKRFFAGAFRQTKLQTRGTHNSHTSTIYCLQLYTYPDTGLQVLFTGTFPAPHSTLGRLTSPTHRLARPNHQGMEPLDGRCSARDRRRARRKRAQPLRAKRTARERRQRRAHRDLRPGLFARVERHSGPRRQRSLRAIRRQAPRHLLQGSVSRFLSRPKTLRH